MYYFSLAIFTTCNMWVDLRKGTNSCNFSLRTKTCKRVMFPVKSENCIIHTCGIVPTSWPSLKPEVLSCSSNHEEWLHRRYVYGCNNKRVTGRFLIIDRAYVRTLSGVSWEWEQLLKCNKVQQRAHLLCFHRVPLTQNRRFVQIGPFSQVCSHIHGCWPLIDDKEWHVVIHCCVFYWDIVGILQSLISLVDNRKCSTLSSSLGLPHERLTAPSVLKFEYIL